jgi:hypothetical protein
MPVDCIAADPSGMQGKNAHCPNAKRATAMNRYGVAPNRSRKEERWA